MSEKNKEKPVLKSKIAEREEEILKFWREKEIFKKSLAKNSPKGEFVFYDGPPFATGTPHYGHILASAIKDAVPRYQTMKGKHVSRRWGWDCHGLPIENIVEKDLKVSGKKQIEALGIKQFNEYARSKVLTYVNEWKKSVERIGRWVDFDGSYKTMDNTYIESVWWALNELNKKNAIYESTKVLPYCPRCETPMANSEIAMDNSYKDISDISLYVKFELVDEPKTFVLAWTTTPWTLPGNFALAVNPEIDYVKVNIKEGENQGIYIFAKNLLPNIVKNLKHDVLETFKGTKLVGKSYKPLFDYFLKSKGQYIENAWKIYGASFVTITDGTGVVHIAPGYGEEDMALAKKEKIPFIHHVTFTGTFTADVKDFAGIQVKPKDTKENPTNHQSADILVIKHLAGKGLLFGKEKIVHSYPHCYRCETPLYYYAMPSWFIKISDVKEKVLKTNEGINWVPSHLKYGRYAKTVENAPDWNISRNRYWASPLPIWKCDLCKRVEFVGSVNDIKKKTGGRNKFLVVRHGESESNLMQILSSSPKTKHHLTEKGKEQAKIAGGKLIDSELLTKESKKVDVIYCSPFLRTKETAEIIADQIGYPKNKIIYDERLHEIFAGEMDGKLDSDYQALFTSREEKFTKAPKGGENHTTVKNRMTQFLYETDQRNENKNILIISHNTPIWLMFSGVQGLTPKEAIAIRNTRAFIENSEIKEISFAPIPHNDNYELDLHRPYIDDIKFPCDCGGAYKRITEVLDCWFESGSMPFAANHYPFESQRFNPGIDANKKALNFPAQFVAEYIAQTRTWFYYMHVVSLFMFGKIPFENIVVTGTVLAEDGEKMSKSKNNFPDPELVFDKYGVDVLRFYLFSSQVMKGEDMNFSERDLDAIYKKNNLRLSNVVSFYELFKDDSVAASKVSKNLLDQWILIRLKQLASDITSSMDAYELDKATRPISDFIDDVSVWYLRRSRDRFKNTRSDDRKNAISTIKFILREFSKLVAPFMPFVAEDLYLKITAGKDMESVHLENWPEECTGKLSVKEIEIIENMKETRMVVSAGLEARVKAGIKVRQPLAKLKVKSEKLKDNTEYFELIKDEINVKEVIFDGLISNSVELDTVLTKELKEEGMMRDVVRVVQEMRKTKKLNTGDLVDLMVTTDSVGKDFFKKFSKEISRITGLKEISFEKLEGGELIELDGLKAKMVIK